MPYSNRSLNVLEVSNSEMCIEMEESGSYSQIRPEKWSREQVEEFLHDCVREFDLCNIQVLDFQMNGKALCMLTKDDFRTRIPNGGDVVYNYLQRFHQSPDVEGLINRSPLLMSPEDTPPEPSPFSNSSHESDVSRSPQMLMTFGMRTSPSRFSPPESIEGGSSLCGYSNPVADRVSPPRRSSCSPRTSPGSGTQPDPLSEALDLSRRPSSREDLADSQTFVTPVDSFPDLINPDYAPKVITVSPRSPTMTLPTVHAHTTGACAPSYNCFLFTENGVRQGDGMAPVSYSGTDIKTEPDLPKTNSVIRKMLEVPGSGGHLPETSGNIGASPPDFSTYPPDISSMNGSRYSPNSWIQDSVTYDDNTNTTWCTYRHREEIRRRAESCKKVVALEEPPVKCRVLETGSPHGHLNGLSVNGSTLAPHLEEGSNQFVTPCPGGGGIYNGCLDEEMNHNQHNVCMQLSTTTLVDSHLPGCDSVDGNDATRHTAQRESGKKKEPPLLWEFIAEILEMPEKYSDVIRWLNQKERIFRIMDTGRFAKMWENKKNKGPVTYDNLSRSLRYYYKSDILHKEAGKLTYRFQKDPHTIVKGKRGAKPGVPHRPRGERKQEQALKRKAREMEKKTKAEDNATNGIHEDQPMDYNDNATSSDHGMSETESMISGSDFSETEIPGVKTDTSEPGQADRVSETEELTPSSSEVTTTTTTTTIMADTESDFCEMSPQVGVFDTNQTVDGDVS